MAVKQQKLLCGFVGCRVHNIYGRSTFERCIFVDNLNQILGYLDPKTVVGVARASWKFVRSSYFVVPRFAYNNSNRRLKEVLHMIRGDLNVLQERIFT